MRNNSPQILVFAGPNGSGKSTVTAGYTMIGEYINADEIKRYEKCSDLQAAQTATALREYFLVHNKSFSFETVLSSDRNVELLKRAKAAGYEIFMVFVLTKDVSINIQRVQERVKNGGHPVPVDKIRSRYSKSIANLSKVLQFVDIVKVIDNSSDVPQLIIEMEHGHAILHETEYWTIKKLQDLVNGTKEQEST